MSPFFFISLLTASGAAPVTPETPSATPSETQTSAPRVEAACDYESLALLTVDEPEPGALPVIDRWQVTWQNISLSDHQLALLAGDNRLESLYEEELQQRSTWVFIGLAAAAIGTALSSVGWVLLGQSGETQTPLGITLPLAIGGVALGGGGILFMSQTLQSPLEPFIAPSPEHRLSRDQARQLVSQINRQLVDRCRLAAQR